MPHSVRQRLLFLLLVVPGLIIVAVCLYYALLDWAVLQKAQAHFQFVAAHSTNRSALFIAEATQNIHRINIFAEVIWALLGAILAAIGLHGLCAENAQ
jgi:hypothetical protein